MTTAQQPVSAPSIRRLLPLLLLCVVAVSGSVLLLGRRRAEQLSTAAPAAKRTHAASVQHALLKIATVAVDLVAGAVLLPLSTRLAAHLGAYVLPAVTPSWLAMHSFVVSRLHAFRPLGRLSGLSPHVALPAAALATSGTHPLAAGRHARLFGISAPLVVAVRRQGALSSPLSSSGSAPAGTAGVMSALMQATGGISRVGKGVAGLHRQAVVLERDVLKWAITRVRIKP